MVKSNFCVGGDFFKIIELKLISSVLSKSSSIYNTGTWCYKKVITLLYTHDVIAITVKLNLLVQVL